MPLCDSTEPVEVRGGDGQADDHDVGTVMSPFLERLERRRLLNAAQLDLSFGDHGIFIDTAVTVPEGVDQNGTPIAGNPIDRVLIQPDGRILIAGHGNGGSVFLEALHAQRLARLTQ